MHYSRWRRHGDPLVVHPWGRQRDVEGKNTKRAATAPTMRDLYWAAGFIEGEGCFSATTTERVRVSQVNREPIDRLVSLFGGTTKLDKAQHSIRAKYESRPIWCWSVYGARAQGVMMTLYALMSAKRQRQIREALA